MKTIKLLLVIFITSITITSCTVSQEQTYYPPLEEVISYYDLYYVDYNSTVGSGDVPFLSKAFTISFLNGRLYVNNNIVDIGYTGDGYGIEIGYYDTYTGLLEINHDLEGNYQFEVYEIYDGRLELRDTRQNVSYFLDGYIKNTFDFDQIFYDNIEYFLQEYSDWEKTYWSEEGELNDFDNENFLAFTWENITTFYSSIDEVGTDIEDVKWPYEGSYEVFDVKDYNDLKILTLDYDAYGTEEFELFVIDDETIELYHNASGTTYEFTGREFIQYLKPGSEKDTVRNEGRKRTKVQRETKVRKNRK